MNFNTIIYEKQEEAARSIQPDYIGVGPVFPTPTKATPDPTVPSPSRPIPIAMQSLRGAAILGIGRFGQASRLGLHRAEDVEEAVRPRRGEAGLEAGLGDEAGVDRQQRHQATPE